MSLGAGWTVVLVCLAAGEPGGADRAGQTLTIESALLTVSRQAEVPARLAGLIQEIKVREGQAVNVGDMLVQLDDAEARLARDRAALDLERARKLARNDLRIRHAQEVLDLATIDMQRAMAAEQKLPGSVSAAELDQLRSQGRRARLDLQQAVLEQETAVLAERLAENSLQAAEEQLSRCRIVTPISGTVVSLAKRLGEWSEPGQPLVRVVATDTLRAEFLLEANLAEASLLQREVRFLRRDRPSQETPASGRITLVHPEVDPLSKSVRVWAEIENPTGLLRPGLSGTVRILP